MRADGVRWPWEPRGPGEPTANYLGRVLDGVGGLGDMPRRAREGHFDDYFAPADVGDGMEMIRLVSELNRRRTKLGPAGRARVELVIDAVKEGEFDGTSEESARWAASKDGQDAMNELPPQMRKALFGDD